MLNDPRIQKILKKNSCGYDEYRSEKIGNESIFMHFVNIYTKSKKENKSVCEFLKEAYHEAKKYETIIINANNNHYSKK
jgi:predicted transcriptional regulator